MTFEEPQEERSQAGYWAAVGALIVILLLGLWLLLRLLSGGETAVGTVEVPDVTGIAAEDAYQTLQSLNLKFRTLQETSDEIDVGFVIRTDPPAGTDVETESFVDVIVSAGEEQLGVPNVIGENVDVAASRIETQGFVVGVREYIETEDYDENIVISQTPDGGSTASPGTAVDIIVSAGPSSLEVPDVSGKSSETAILELARAGFETIETLDEFSADVLQGFVIETNPAAGQTVPKEATIIVMVSQGPEPVNVPDLVGMSQSQASQSLNALCLLIDVSSDTVEVSIASGLVGNVAEQDPPVGIEVDFGSSVTVKLGVVQQVAVPDVVGDALVDAEIAISSAGLTLATPTTTVTNVQADDKKVATQSPGGGTLVDEGSTVAMTVWLYQPDVPDFAGMTLTEAQSLADSLGLGTITHNSGMDVVDALETPDTIATQSVSPGTSVSQGSGIEVGFFKAA